MSSVNPSKRTPADYLKSVLGRPAVVKLTTGSEFRGVLTALDGFMNIAMEQCEEFDEAGKLKTRYGDALIRGNNVMYITQ
jgi:U6 snRNA-associated Sm-like protein LSm6